MYLFSAELFIGGRAVDLRKFEMMNVELSYCRTVEMSNCRNVEMSNVKLSNCRTMKRQIVE